MTVKDLILVVASAALGLCAIVGLIRTYDRFGKNRVIATIVLLTALTAIWFNGRARSEIIIGGIALSAIIWRVNFSDRMWDRFNRRRQQ